MNFLSLKKFKSSILEILDFIFLILLGSIATAFTSKFHWFFNLFDQLWLFYLILSCSISIFFLIFRQFTKSFFSIIFALTCLIIVHTGDLFQLNEKNNFGFKIYYQNINSSNSSIEELSKSINESNADLVTLVENTPEIEKALEKKAIQYSYKFGLARDDNFGFLILSKIKFTVEKVYEHSGQPFYVKIFIGKHNTNIYLLHLPPPLWNEAWLIQKETLSLIAKEISDDRKFSYVVLGDLNMVPSSSIFKKFSNELRPKFSSGAKLFFGSWPYFLPQYLRLPIDHVFSDRKFGVHMGPPAGSDHKSLIVETDL